MASEPAPTATRSPIPSAAISRSITIFMAPLSCSRRALEISHAEYSDTVLAFLDPAQREQLQDEDAWIARQLFVGDLIDQILAVPPETIT